MYPRKQWILLGKLIAGEDWILLCGGRPAGVMEAPAKGTKEVGGLNVGILSGRSKTGASENIDIAIAAGF
ncbi:MAG: hypothetical protein PHU78_08520 [Heliobacteriaceae bacterium]|nr:hypothetical protein [Heliobacteriaceae bacterium]